MNKATSSVELVLPERQNTSNGMRILGYLCRAALAFLCAFGLSVYLVDALSFGISRPKQALICLLFCAVFAVMGISVKFFLGGTLLGVGAASLWLFAAGELAERLTALYLAGVSLYNAWFLVLDEKGFRGSIRNILDVEHSMEQLSLTEDDCRFIAYFVIMLFLCAVSCFCIVRRAHMIPLLFLGTALSTITMYFGLCKDNTGFALMLASLCGTAALSYYDNIYSSKKHVAKAAGTLPHSKESKRDLRQIIRTNAALGGFCGLFSAMVALMLLWIPSQTQTYMPDIPSISHPMLRLERFVVAMVNGDSPDVGGLIFSGITDIDSRSTATEQHAFSGAPLFEVRAELPTPIYLRNWVGIDYYDDSWHTASYERIADYKELFGKDFSSERLTFDLLEALDPALVKLPEGVGSKKRTELGYITAHVHIKKLIPSANLLFMPSYTDQRLGLLQYGTRIQENIEYSNYFDGIFTGSAYLFLDEYSTVSNLPLLTDRNFADNIGVLISYFVKQHRLITPMRGVFASTSSETAMRQTYEELIRTTGDAKYSIAGEKYTFPTGEKQLAWRYAYEMNAAERDRIHMLFDTLAAYYDYVYDNYLTASEGEERFSALASEILQARGIEENSVRTFHGRHLATMAIIDYLSEEMTYTLAPKAPSSDREYINAAETFLFDTGEGYCVQYATSAVVLLRSLGIPARYAEGYITGTYSELSKEDPVGRYRTVIADSNAHAWIEVYFDNYGWIQYEATTPYYAGMYEQTSNAPQSPNPQRPYQGEPDDIIEYPDEIDSPYLPSEDTFKLSGSMLAGLIAFLIVCIAAVFSLLLRKRALVADDQRQTLISKACSRTLDDDERPNIAKKLDDGILRLLAFKKLVPEAGEHQRAFAARVDEAFGIFASHPFSLVSEAMMAGEFGTEISQTKLEVIARYYADLLDYVMRNEKLPRRILLKYFYLTK